jgi:23S rRNA (cytidine1920-2'-O)/16S rRNA (cytidine1409-2'-O)-methyltransferase
MARKRADVLLCDRGLATSRVRAQTLIRNGSVLANGMPVVRPSALVDENAALALSGGPKFVSRGGDKLDRALDRLGVDVRGAVVVDIGASTGGFTDCVLQRGAARVYAIDVGHGQLVEALRGDPRVVSREGVNARTLSATDFPEPVDVVLVDASFISLEKLTEALGMVVRPGGIVIALVKPQFEVGRDAARRARGVVRDAETRARAIASARDALISRGFRIAGECDSEVPGPKGNVEHFLHATLKTP